ncbi:hypothetical protein [Pseudomonas typographi]|uniref:hypothetical protein n=1 Tax=Pseudomonas typographi TaxID=2715964 RepID=UPI001687A685|nr:hypothetical protein [Pseudomonas typographi]MBD1587227.1 hypothetical protein [Pseudomonas typographi]
MLARLTSTLCQSAPRISQVRERLSVFRLSNLFKARNTSARFQPPNQPLITLPPVHKERLIRLFNELDADKACVILEPRSINGSAWQQLMKSPRVCTTLRESLHAQVERFGEGYLFTQLQAARKRYALPPAGVITSLDSLINSLDDRGAHLFNYHPVNIKAIEAQLLARLERLPRTEINTRLIEALNAQPGITGPLFTARHQSALLSPTQAPKSYSATSLPDAWPIPATPDCPLAPDASRNVAKYTPTPEPAEDEDEAFGSVLPVADQENESQPPSVPTALATGAALAVAKAARQIVELDLFYDHRNQQIATAQLQVALKRLGQASALSLPKSSAESQALQDSIELYRLILTLMKSSRPENLRELVASVGPNATRMLKPDWPATIHFAMITKQCTRPQQTYERLRCLSQRLGNDATLQLLADGYRASTR